jgi:hypothetical protein
MNSFLSNTHHGIQSEFEADKKVIWDWQRLRGKQVDQEKDDHGVG